MFRETRWSSKIRSTVLPALLTVAACLAFIAPARAQQQTKPTFIAPVPPILQNAKTVFIADGGADPDIAQRLSSNTPANLPFNQFYALMQEWGRFQIVTSPSDADLVVEVTAAQVPNNCTGNSLTPCNANKLQVSIFDGKSKFRIRTFAEPADSAILGDNFSRNFSAATQKAFRDFQALTAPPPAQ